MKTIVFDIETTGLDPIKNAIVSIGAVDVTTGDEFYEESHVPPGSEISPDALRVNGFTEEEVTDPKKLSQKEIYEKFAKFTNDHNADTLSGFNIIKFDLLFLAHVARANGIQWKLPRKIIDLKPEFEHKVVEDPRFETLRNQVDTFFPPRNHNGNKEAPLQKINAISMNRALKYFGIDDEPNPHNALGGAKYATELFGLLYLKSHYLKIYEKYPMPIVFKGIEFSPIIEIFDFNSTD